MLDILGSTPVWTQCILFYGFQDIKTYVYILFSKSICSIKEHWWSLTLSWPDKVQRMFLTAHEISNEKLNHRRFYDDLYKLYDFTLIFTLVKL